MWKTPHYASLTYGPILLILWGVHDTGLESKLPTEEGEIKQVSRKSVEPCHSPNQNQSQFSKLFFKFSYYADE